VAHKFNVIKCDQQNDHENLPALHGYQKSIYSGTRKRNIMGGSVTSERIRNRRMIHLGKISKVLGSDRQTEIINNDTNSITQEEEYQEGNYIIL